MQGLCQIPQPGIPAGLRLNRSGLESTLEVGVETVEPFGLNVGEGQVLLSENRNEYPWPERRPSTRTKAQHQGRCVGSVELTAVLLIPRELSVECKSV